MTATFKLFETLSNVSLPCKRKVSKENLKQAIDLLKSCLREEQDPEIKKRIAQVGIELNTLFLKR